MLLALLAAGAVGTLDPAMVKPPATPAHCDRELARAATLTPAEARKLGQLPPGLLQLAVYKRVAGCAVAVLPVRDANGNHVMMLSEQPPQLRHARRAPSDGQRGSKRQR